MKVQFNPCPLCGQKDKTETTSREVFQSLLNENGSVAISVECRRCGVEVWAYCYGTSTAYETLCEELAKKWNRLRGVKHEAVHVCA